METFVVRVWVQEDGSDGALRGVVEQPRTGRSHTFVGAAELVALLSTSRTISLETPDPSLDKGVPT